MKQFVGFHIKSMEYMIPILTVREIITMPSITVLPQFPEYVIGVTNLRGSIIPILDLKVLLNVDADKHAEHVDSSVVVVASGDLTFGIIVDGITGVINMDETKIEQPESFFNTDVEKIQGVAKFDDKLVILLDIRKLLPIHDMTLFAGDITDTLESEGDGNAETVQGSETGLFNELGTLTRKFHDSLEEFKESVNHNLFKLTKDKGDNAVDKLEFVINKTEEAANKTIMNAERFFEESNDFIRHVENIAGYDEDVNYLKAFREALDNDMTEILTAQQFQDITGQTIRKVIAIVNNVESELAKIIANFGASFGTGAGTAIADADTADIAASSENKITQSDVESLLQKYGF